ncbi:MAG: NUDIX domain-containing protein [Gemmatimonadaceae bacterium]
MHPRGQHLEPGEPTIRVLAAGVRIGGEYLVCRRPPHTRHCGRWEFPGGKGEPIETDFDAARRELHAELNVQVTGVGEELFAVHDPGSPFLIAFVEVKITGTPLCHEHTELRWGRDRATRAREARHREIALQLAGAQQVIDQPSAHPSLSREGRLREPLLQEMSE